VAGGAVHLAGIISSLKKLVAFVILTVVLAGITIAFFELFVAGPAKNLRGSLELLGTLSIVFAFALISIYLLTHVKRLLTPYIGLQTATITQYLLVLVALTVTAFIILGLFAATLSALLASAGIITITVGLIISTFVGGILSGALVSTTHQLRIGDDVMVNNMPGKVVDMSALVMRIRTDVGQITIPNSAVASGGVIITAVRAPQPAQETRLPYVLGDRVLTSFRNEEGVIRELTAFHTTVLLDSGREITFLNNTVLTGATAIAKITQKPPPS
jgi:small-conductance mechanosensitive channel